MSSREVVGVVHNSLYDTTTLRSLLGAVVRKYAPEGVAVFTEAELQQLTDGQHLQVELRELNDGLEQLRISVGGPL